MSAKPPPVKLPTKPLAKGLAAPGLAKLRQVAARAGVSASTASRVFNHPQLVAPATLERVRRVVAEMDFVPNPTARALSRGRSRLIGALIPTIGYSIYAHYMAAVHSACSAEDYTLVLGVYQFDEQEELRQAQRLVDVGVEGLLLVGFNHDPRLFDALRARQLPYVCTSVHRARSEHPNVGYDNFGAGRRIAEYLMSLGHRRFGLITGDMRRNDRMAMRLAGIRAGLRQQGLELPDGAVFEGDYTLSDGRTGFKRIYGECQPTALICGNDVIALGALQQARDDQVSVPQDLSIIGFDGLGWAAQFSPAMTTMQVPMDQMGQRAATSLIARIEGRTTPHAVEIAVQLVVRETTAAPREVLPKTAPHAPKIKAAATARRGRGQALER